MKRERDDRAPGLRAQFGVWRDGCGIKLVLGVSSGRADLAYPAGAMIECIGCDNEDKQPIEQLIVSETETNEKFESMRASPLAR